MVWVTNAGPPNVQHRLQDIVARLGFLVQSKGSAQLRGCWPGATNHPILLHDSLTMVEKSANAMPTAVTMGRIVDHYVILEFEVPSYRTGKAHNRRAGKKQTGKNA